MTYLSCDYCKEEHLDWDTEKTFDDGTVKYFHPSNRCGVGIDYRITVAPSGITLDKISGKAPRRTFRVVSKHPNFSSASRALVHRIATDKRETKTRQPKWKLVANLGDVNPWEHGGFLVFEDRTGIYNPEASIIAPDEENENMVYLNRILMAPCFYNNGILSDNHFHLDCPVWFADELDSICSFGGVDRHEFVEDLCSEDSFKIGRCYQLLVYYYGAANFGGQDSHVPTKEAKKRFKGYRI